MVLCLLQVMPLANRGRYQSSPSSTIFLMSQWTYVSNLYAILCSTVTIAGHSDPWLDTAGVCSSQVLRGGEGVSSSTLQAIVRQDCCVYHRCRLLQCNGKSNWGVNLEHWGVILSLPIGMQHCKGGVQLEFWFAILQEVDSRYINDYISPCMTCILLGRPMYYLGMCLLEKHNLLATLHLNSTKVMRFLSKG